jgi:hypothetical protein
METVNRTRMVRTLYATLRGAAGLNLDNVIAATAEGYPFPTNLDSNPPLGGMAPKTQADYLRQALAEGQSEAAFFAVLDALDQKNQS